MDSMQILSRLYDLLSQCSDKDLRDAARLAGKDGELAHAIMLLGAYKRGARGRRPAPAPRSPTRSQQVYVRSKYSNNGLGKKLSEVILSKQYLSNNKELVDYLRQLKLPFRVDARDSRKRIYNQLVKWIEGMPVEKQKDTYVKLLRVLPQSDTAGWFDVIRDSKS